MVECVNGQMQLSIKMILKSKHLRKKLESRLSCVKKKYGLKTVDVEILLYMFWKENEDISAAEISKAMILNKGQVSTAIDDLINQEYILMRLSEKDKRVRYFSLTKKGSDLVKELNAKTNAFCEELLEDISEEEILIFHEVMEKLEKKFNELLF